MSEAHEYGKIVSQDRQSLTQENGYAGGSRIKEIRNYTGQNNGTRKTYHYVLGFTGNNLSACPSSGILNGRPQYVFDIEDRPVSSGTITASQGYASGSQPYSYNAMGTHIGYSEVIEMERDGSYTKHVFTNYDTDMHGISHFDHKGGYLGWIGTDAYIPTSSLERERGKLLAEYVYNNEKELVKRIVLKYTNDPSRFNHYIKQLEMRDIVGCNVDQGNLILATGIKNYTYKYNVTSREVTDYNPSGNPVTSLQTINYNEYNQVSEESTVQSDKRKLKVKYKYAADFSDLPVIKKMQDAHILSPVTEQMTLIDDQLIEAEVIKYKEFYPGIFKPEQVSRFGSTVPISGTDTAGLIRPEAYFDFDNGGRLVNLTLKSSYSTVYLWGYHGQYPIARIENASMEEVRTAMGMTDAGIDALASKLSPSDADFTLIRELSARLPGTLVSVYRYRPLLDIISETDPSGKSIFYEYDSTGRLILIKDDHENIIRSYQYNYMNHED